MEQGKPIRENRRLFGTALVSAVLAVLVLLNVIVGALSARFGWYFYSAERYEHTVGDASYALFEDVEEGKSVRVLFCMSEDAILDDPIYSLVLNTVRQLAERHDFIDIEFKNIYLNPGEVKPFRTRTLATGEVVEYSITDDSVIFVSGEDESDFRVERMESFFVLDSSKVITAYNGEETALSCLAWVLRDTHPVAAFTVGHGENFGELLAFYTTLTAAGYDVTALDPSEPIPDGLSLIAIVNPRWDFDRAASGSTVEAELDRLEAFLAGGGDLFVSLDPYVKSDLSNLRAFLAARGLLATQEVIRDLENSITYDGFTLVTEMAESDLAGRISERIGAYTGARAIVKEASSLLCTEAEGWLAEPILSSSPTSETYKNGVKTGEAGRYTVLAASSRTAGGAPSTVILTSSVFLLANDVMNSGTYINRDVVLSVIEDASGMTAPVGCRLLPIENQRIEDLTMGVARLYAVLLTLALPLAVAAVGTLVCIRRRRK